MVHAILIFCGVRTVFNMAEDVDKQGILIPLFILIIKVWES